ncbi:MAG: hypothetical protein GX146_04755 [Myxococcales bacterium]|jgi:hypothetical protein|nr:hypothetical protein [Myxococcales bacterium]
MKAMTRIGWGALAVLGVGLSLVAGQAMSQATASAPLKIRFSHTPHKDLPCATCHSDSPEVVPPSSRMQRCYDCHRQQRANTACKTCHLTHPDGRMKHDADGVRRVPPTWLAGPTHGAAWERTHGASAGANASFCQNCHAQKYCTDCHAGRRAVKRHHPPGWMTAHALSARIDEAACSRCHRQQSFCLDCHRRSGRAPSSPVGVRSTNPVQFHKGKSPAEICRRAKNDLITCVSCHNEASCIRCHSRINPHPPGFSQRCRRLANAHAGACQKCHATSPARRCQ